MKCLLCESDGKDDDYFLLKNKICYKCAFQQKTHSIEKPKKRENCVICDQELTGERRVYCSTECSNIQKTRKTKAHWTRTIKIYCPPRNQFRF